MQERWTRRHAAEPEDTDDTGIEVVTPTGYPGRVRPRWTGRRPAHSSGEAAIRPAPRQRGLLVVASIVVLALASIAVAGLTRIGPRGQHSDVETRVANPLPTNLTPLVGSTPPDDGSPAVNLTLSAAPPTTANSPHPDPAPVGVAAPRTYRAVSGESCPPAADHGFFRTGFASDWRARTSGGLTTDGCHGAMVAVPMSGDAKRDDNDNVVVWWFRTAPVVTGSCAVSVYVPDTGTDSDSAGRPAHYEVFGTDTGSGATTGQFDVDQTRNRGRWVDTGRYPTGGRFSVRLVTRGIDFGPGRAGAHLGVSALRVVCG